ncbi:MAG: heme-binding domain-containing protein [Verrucomicrobiota bacterium]
MKPRACAKLAGYFLLLLQMGIQLSAGKEVGQNLQQENLVAWCIVPFDAKKRGPAERAQMLVDLGIRRCAYDWRNEHIPQFEQEIIEYKKHGIEFFAFWGGHEKAFELFEKYDLHPQIWTMVGKVGEGSQEEKIEAAANKLEAVAKRTVELGCKLGIYNHGGWSGESKNMVAVCKRLRKRGYAHVGIVYNWHHGHEHIKDWGESLKLMQPFLHCLNINGMNANAAPKILTLAQGEHEMAMLKTILESGYDGPIGILDHQMQLDSKEVLADNLAGLKWLKKEIQKPGSGGKPPIPKAKKVSMKPPVAAIISTPMFVPSVNENFGKALARGMMVKANADRREPPITVECRVKIRDRSNYNILVASDKKASNAHWEIFTMKGSGELTVYLPGATPDHVRSKKVITDDHWHSVAMHYAADHVQLWVDGKVVANQKIQLKPNRKVVPGGVAFGQLVEGEFGGAVVIDEVRIRRGIHDDLGKITKQPFQSNAENVIVYRNFDDLQTPAPLVIFNRKPLEPQANPYWKESINRDRIYDFYAKQALHYGSSKAPSILPPFPGLDGGIDGHWGNQNDQDTWKDGRIRKMDHGSAISGVFRGAGKTIARAVSVDLGNAVNAVFDQDSLRFELAWKGALVKWSDVRRGLMHGIPMGGEEQVAMVHIASPAADAVYLGMYRVGKQVVFSYRENGQVKYRTASVVNGKVVESVTNKPQAGTAQWPERVETKGKLGEGQPYAIDTLTLPYKNPWNALFFVSGLDFLSENRIAICTMYGDVWIADVSGEDLSKLTWKRFAGGLHQPLGLKVKDGVIHVMCRDQLVALHDINGDDEADFYQCVFNIQKTSPGGHSFITGLQQDDQGRWYFASGNEGVCRVSADGKKLKVLGSGLRNPNGLGISPSGDVVLSSVQEGNWTPASAICDVSRGGHFGAGGPKPDYVPAMLYLPRGVDNSSGGQVYIDSGRWGPVSKNWVHFSGGFATHFLVLREVIGETSQAAAIVLSGEFLSGSHRGRFSPYDGQLYVGSAQGWGNYGVADGALQRVRYTGGAYPYPTKYQTQENGILLTFAEPQTAEVADIKRWFAQQWNYLYGPGYGSAEYSVKNPGKKGHDQLEIRSVHRIGDGRQIFIEIPQLQPVNQFQLHFAGTRRIEIFATIHQLGEPYTDFPGYEKITKTGSTGLSINTVAELTPAALMSACATCHHPTKRVVGPPFSEIRQRYANNPDGIVKWAMNPENKNPELPPMPSFNFLGKEKLKIIAKKILSGGGE